MNRYFIISIALVGGALLAAMIALNSYLVVYVSPLGASWIAHGTGAFVALCIVYWVRHFIKPIQPANGTAAPYWAFLGGIPGAFVVVLAVIVVNSPMGLSGAMVLGIVGQVVFGLLADQWGWFGMVRRKLTRRRSFSSLLILAGCFLIIFSKGSL